MTILSQPATSFEDLSDDIIISIFEYLPLEDCISIFEKLNTRLTCIVFDHPWTHYQLSIRNIDNDALQKKRDFIENMKLQSRISSIAIRPYSIHRSIEIFNLYSPIYNFVNLQALSLTNVTLEEADEIFTPHCLSMLVHLTRLCIIFSHRIEQNDCLRIERLLARILTRPSLRHCTIHASRPLDFSQIQSPSPIEYLDVDYCSFLSLYTLFEFVPCLRHLSATIVLARQSEEKLMPTPLQIPPLLNSLKLNYSIENFDDLTNFLTKLSKLQKLDIASFSVVENPIYTASWFKFITQHFPDLIKFKRVSPVALENIAAHIESFRWPNSWHLKTKTVPIGTNYSQVKVMITKY